MFKLFRKLSKKESQSLEDCLSQNGLPFDTAEEAEKHFFAQRDKDLEELQQLNRQYPGLQLDFKAASLRRIEAHYFNCFIDKTLPATVSKDRFEELLTQYMRQVFVTNEMAEWKVWENDFSEGRYELGLLYGYGSGTSERYASGLDTQKDNKDRSYLYNKFMAYVPAERESEVQ